MQRKKKAKQRWAIEKPKLDNARQLRGIFTCRNIGNDKTKYACIVDADQSMKIRLEGVPHRYHEDHIAAKGTNSLNHYNLVHQ